MATKPEPVLRKVSRIAIVGVVVATIFMAALFAPHHLSLGFWEWLGIWFVSLVLMATILLITYFKTVSGVKLKDHHLRGSELIPYKTAFKRATKLVKEAPAICWGCLNIPAAEGTNHFAIIGATGSGKTMSLRMLMQSVLHRIGTGDTRALIYDAKTDMLPILANICPDTRVVIFNPFDARSSAWDMAKDVTTPASCQQLAAALISEEGRAGGQPYFRNTARHFVMGILTVFNKRARGQWTFRDLMVAKSRPDYVKAILGSEPETKHQLEHFSRDDTVKDVFSTLQTCLAKYEFVAAAWDHAEERVSLVDWLESEFIILLGNNTVAAEATKEINRVIFQRMSELLLGGEETETRQSWIFLDEVRQAGKLDSLNDLLLAGRSKGACCVLGFQDIEGMREVYGSKVANELVGQCSNKTILRVNSPETADWASKLFGEKEVFENRRSSNQSHDSFFRGSTSESTGRVRRQLVTPGELMGLPKTHPETGLHGFYSIPRIGSYSFAASGEDVSRNLLSKNSQVQGFEGRPEEHQTLREWRKEDFLRLGLSSVAMPREVKVVDRKEEGGAEIGGDRYVKERKNSKKIQW